MHLVDVVQDHTMPVPGYEHRTFRCSACGDIEQRFGHQTRWVKPHQTCVGAYGTTDFGGSYKSQ
jgi:hypothetical protein